MPETGATAFRPGDGGPLTRRRASRGRLRAGSIAALVILAVAGAYVQLHRGERDAPPAPRPPPPQVTVSTPLQQIMPPTTSFLGQFSAVDSVEIRAQVGGTLTAIAFRDGQIVHKGDPLFTIDPRPFAIRLDQAQAQLQTAEARRQLADVELWRAQQLRQSTFGTVEAVDQRSADQRSAEAAIDTAQAAIRDAQLDLEFAHVTAPFTGRIGAHLASIGSLVSGSRGGTGPSTLLATIVSLDPIHLDFDMSEADYLAYQRGHRGGAPNETVAISLGDDGRVDRQGTLDFIDNAVDRSSGTIHARATVPNADLMLTPGQFARLSVPMGPAVPALLIPPAAVVPDQSQHLVMTVGADGAVVPKPVLLGGLYRGLRIVRSGLAATDRVVISGLIRVRPGAPVTPVPGTVTLGTD